MTQTATTLPLHPTPHCFGVMARDVPERFDEAWQLLEPAAARNGMYTREDVWRNLMKGEFQLWVAETDVMVMAAVTEVADYPNLRCATVVLLGGVELERCLPFLDTLEAWARSCGCQRFYGSGRRGLARKLAQRGYRESSVIIVKDLTNA